MTSLPPVLPRKLAHAATAIAWWLVLLGLAPVPAGAAVNQEAAALLTIRSGFTNGEALLPDWNNASSSPCTWKGVVCDPDTSQVTTVLLAGQGLRGNITADGWMQLEGLQVLTLSFNSFYGPIPANFTLPSSLLQLALGSTSLTGSIPKDWKLPSALRMLYLDHNYLSGTISSNWTLPDSLQVLVLDNNPQLTGTIPQDWALPSALVTLRLSECNFTGPLPTRYPSGMQILDLSQNSLTGTIPANLTLPSGLRDLWLYDNQLTGSISKDWKLPRMLKTMVLLNNQLTGTLDPAWELPESLEYLNFGFNDLSGQLPAWNLPNLYDATLYGCNFTGPLPAYPARPSFEAYVMPQLGDGFCGEVPSSPSYYAANAQKIFLGDRLTNGSFDSCPPGTPPRYVYPPAGPPRPVSPGNSTSDGGGSSSTVGIAVGVAVGVSASVAAVLGVWWWTRRKRRKHVAAPTSQVLAAT